MAHSKVSDKRMNSEWAFVITSDSDFESRDSIERQCPGKRACLNGDPARETRAYRLGGHETAAGTSATGPLDNASLPMGEAPTNEYYFSKLILPRPVRTGPDRAFVATLIPM